MKEAFAKGQVKELTAENLFRCSTIYQRKYHVNGLMQLRRLLPKTSPVFKREECTYFNGKRVTTYNQNESWTYGVVENSVVTKKGLRYVVHYDEHTVPEYRYFTAEDLLTMI